MKDTWLEHSTYSGKKNVVYYQKEVDQMMNTLGIPAISLSELLKNDKAAAAYDPLEDITHFPNFCGCGLRHEYNLPCQGLLASRLVEFVRSKEIAANTTREKADNATVDLHEDKATQISVDLVPAIFEDEITKDSDEDDDLGVL